MLSHAGLYQSLHSWCLSHSTGCSTLGKQTLAAPQAEVGILCGSLGDVALASHAPPSHTYHVFICPLSATQALGNIFREQRGGPLSHPGHPQTSLKWVLQLEGLLVEMDPQEVIKTSALKSEFLTFLQGQTAPHFIKSMPYLFWRDAIAQQLLWGLLTSSEV